MFKGKEERSDETFFFPFEAEEHEATWLEWPHSYPSEKENRKLEAIWVKMVAALTKG